MTLDQLLESYDIHEPERQHIKVWLRMELAKMVSNADCKHIAITSFDQSLVNSVKNVINYHIFKEWEL